MNEELSSLLEELKSAGLDVSSARIRTGEFQGVLHILDAGDRSQCDRSWTMGTVKPEGKPSLRPLSLIAHMKDICSTCFTTELSNFMYVNSALAEGWAP